MGSNFQYLLDKYPKEDIKDKLGDAMWEELQADPSDPSDIIVYTEEERDEALLTHRNLQDSGSEGDECPDCNSGEIEKSPVNFDRSQTISREESLGVGTSAGIVMAEAQTTAGRTRANSSTTTVGAEINVYTCDNDRCKNWLGVDQRRAAAMEMDRQNRVESEADTTDFIERGPAEKDHRMNEDMETTSDNNTDNCQSEDSAQGNQGSDESEPDREEAEDVLDHISDDNQESKSQADESSPTQGGGNGINR